MRRYAGSGIMVVAFCLLIAGKSFGANHGSHFAKDASNAIGPFLVVGEAMLIVDKHDGPRKALQGAEALASTGLVTQGLKRAVREKRPDSDSRSSFPSLHASEAFAMATVLSEYKPKYRVLSYGIAGTIAWSRVDLRAHFTHDVVAGAAIGYYFGRYFTRGHGMVSPEGIGLKWRW